MTTPVNPTATKATRINLFNFKTPQMRAFHMSWFAFFVCFLAWFGIAPLMSVVREELALTKEQIGWCIIGSVAVTIFFRLGIGWLCDKIGPRLAYTWLLVLGSLPVMGIAFTNDFQSFLIFRVLIGAIGASFVITQYHTTLMFAPNVVGTANATTAGWGNLGGGVTQFVMPALMALYVGSFGLSAAWGWRASMITTGVAIILTGIAYYFLTQDAPEGNFKEMREAGLMPKNGRGGSFMEAARDYRVWALFVLYAACFGIELTINNIAALYFSDRFGLGLAAAGLAASAFGLMNLFARTLGGVFGDRFGATGGLKGRVKWLFACILLEGLCLMFFSQMGTLAVAIPALILFSLFVQMSEGATFSVVPFISKKSLGSVAGIVGAGGNVGAVSAGFLFKAYEPAAYGTPLLILGAAVAFSSVAAFAVRFAPETEEEAAREFADAVADRQQGEMQPAGA